MKISTAILRSIRKKLVEIAAIAMIMSLIMSKINLKNYTKND